MRGDDPPSPHRPDHVEAGGSPVVRERGAIFLAVRIRVRRRDLLLADDHVAVVAPRDLPALAAALLARPEHDVTARDGVGWLRHRAVDVLGGDGGTRTIAHAAESRSIAAPTPTEHARG